LKSEYKFQSAEFHSYHHVSIQQFSKTEMEPKTKVEAPVVDNLSKFQPHGEEYELVEIFPCRKIGNMGILNFSKFYFQI